MKAPLQVLGTDINFLKIRDTDFVSLTDIARYKNPDEPRYVIQNWMKTRFSVEFLGLWETLNNPNFNRVEFDTFKNESGSNAFVLTPKKWIETTHAIGMISKSGKTGGGTFAHKDIAFEFASWISAEFKLYLITEFQRLKQEEFKALDWSAKRFLTKVNYKIHTDAIQENLIPKELSKKEMGFVYADEADILNKALFGMTAKEWRDQNPGKKGNIRDEATLEQLIILANIESMNAEFIKMCFSQTHRLEILNKTAITQMKSLLQHNISKKLPSTL